DFGEGRIDTGYELPALWSLWLFRIKRGEARMALVLAQRFYDLVTNPADRLVGERMVATAHHFLGHQTDARRIFDAILSRPDARPRLSYAVPIQYDHPLNHPALEALAARMGTTIVQPSGSTLSRILWLQGFPDQARQLAERNVEYARAVD